jgi:hypothetical protein
LNFQWIFFYIYWILLDISLLCIVHECFVVKLNSN